MKTFLKIILGILLGGALPVFAATILFPTGGGTGWGAIQSSAIPYGNGTGRFSTTTQGTPGQVLSWSNGIPTWVATTSVGDGVGNWFTPAANYNSTSTTIGFLQGLFSTGSTTITGNASTTGNFYISGKLGVASTTPATQFDVTGNALVSGTITASNFIDTTFGGNACIGESGGLLNTSNCVSSLASANSSLTISSPTGNVDASINLANSNWYTARQNFTQASTSQLTATSSVWLTGLTAGFTYIGSNSLLTSAASSSLFGYTPLNPTRAVNTTYPLAGGGALSSDLTLTYSGFGTSSPWTQGQLVVAGAGQNTGFTVATGTISAGSTAITVTAGRSAIGGALAIDCAASSGTQVGCLSAADWLTFNNKVATGTTFVSSNLGYFGANGSLFNVATGTVSAGNGVSVTGGRSVIGGSLTITNTIGYPFGNQLGGGNATSSLTGFSGGVLITASSTFSNATSTGNFTVLGSTTLGTIINGAGLATCNSANQAVTWSAGNFGCQSIAGTANAWPWNITTVFGTTTRATTTPEWFQTNFFSSSTILQPSVIDNLVTTNSTSTNATTTNFKVTNLFLGSNAILTSFTGTGLAITTGSLGFATINAGVLGAQVNGSAPTSQATSTLYGAGGIPNSALANSTLLFTYSGNITGPATKALGASLDAAFNVPFSFTPTTSYGLNANSTSTLMLLTSGLNASSTIQVASSTGAQLVLDDATQGARTLLRSNNGNFFISTSTFSGLATSTFGGLAITSGGQLYTTENDLSTSTTMFIDWFKTPNQVDVRILGSAMTIGFNNASTTGMTKRIVVCNGATVASTVTWSVSGLLWSGGTAPVQTTTANKCDIYSFIVSQATSTVFSTVKIFGAATQNY